MFRINPLLGNVSYIQEGVASSLARKKRRPPLRVELLEDRTAPALLNWTGFGGDNLWENPTNWDMNAVPTINDDHHRRTRVNWERDY